MEIHPTMMPQRAVFFFFSSILISPLDGPKKIQIRNLSKGTRERAKTPTYQTPPLVNSDHQNSPPSNNWGTSERKNLMSSGPFFKKSFIIFDSFIFISTFFFSSFFIFYSFHSYFLFFSFLIVIFLFYNFFFFV